MASNRLMYPLIAPRGGVGSDGAVSRRGRYPTKALDYFKFTIYESDDKGSNSYSYVGGKKSGKGAGDKKKIYKTVYLYLPHQLSETFNASYDRAALGPFGSAAVSAMADGNVDNFVDALQSGANSGKTQVAFGAAANIFNGLSGAIGVDGNLSKNQLAALSKGKVFNPYQETVFRGVNYRQHSFDFDMSPRNADEAQSIMNIILTLRDSMLPDTAGANDKWLTIPRFFRAEIVRYTPGEPRISKGASDKLASPQALSTMLTYPVNMVLTGMQVNMTPTGQNNSIRKGMNSTVDFGPAMYKMGLTFDETAFITRGMYNSKKKKGNPNDQHSLPIQPFSADNLNSEIISDQGLRDSLLNNDFNIDFNTSIDFQ